MNGVDGSTRGSILLPVIVVLLLIASAATAMTLQARTSLREAGIRRDRMKLGFMADGLVRAAAQALSAAATGRVARPFRFDGTVQSCALAGDGLMVLAVQDEGGLVDLNKGARELILLVLQRAGVSGWDAKVMTDAILRRRDSEGTNSPPASAARQRPADPSGPFASVDQIDRLPGMSPALFDRLQGLFTVHGDASTLDPAVAAPGIRAVIDRKELAGPAMAALVAPSSNSAFTVTATVVSAQGMRVARRAALLAAPNGSAIRFTGWDAPISFEPLPSSTPDNHFCLVAAGLLGRP